MKLRVEKYGLRVHRVAVLGAALLSAAYGCGTADGQDGSAVGSGTASSAASADSAIRALADRLLPEVETLSALPAREPLAVAVRTRGELEAFLTRQLAEQLPPEKLDGLQRVYVRLGLLPPDLQLAQLLRSLLLEQVVGYYDPARDTLYVMENVDPELVEPVLAQHCDPALGVAVHRLCPVGACADAAHDDALVGAQQVHGLARSAHAHLHLRADRHPLEMLPQDIGRIAIALVAAVVANLLSSSFFT